MKIVFVISSANIKEYGKVWQECLNNENRKEIIDNNPSKRKIVIQTDRNITLYIFDGDYYSNKNDDEAELADEIANAVNKCGDLEPPFFVFFHGPGGRMTTIQAKLKVKGIETKCEEYHRDEDFYKNRIVPFGDCRKDVNELAEELLKEVEGKNKTVERYEILFLPLDIDMQALKSLYDEKINGKNRKNPRAYLKEMYADNVNYLQKFNELQAKAKELGETEGINKERLGKLAGISNGNVCQFFKKLGDEKDDPDEFLGHSWGIDGVNFFHDWYCALSSCLRGAEGCEGK